MRDVLGDEPLRDGMKISVRIRRDFAITDADRVLTTARRLYLEMNPQVSPEDAAAAVRCAADALFVILEHHGVLGDSVDERLATEETSGLEPWGWAAQAVPNEPAPLLPGPRSNCLRDEDMFALPAHAVVEDPQDYTTRGGIGGAQTRASDGAA
jgi:hypothetical protein